MNMIYNLTRQNVNVLSMEVVPTAHFTLMAYKLNRVKKGSHVGHIIGPGTHQVWLQICVNYLCRTLHLSTVYVYRTYKANVLRGFILRGPKVSENCSIYQFALTVICHF